MVITIQLRIADIQPRISPRRVLPPQRYAGSSKMSGWVSPSHFDAESSAWRVIPRYITLDLVLFSVFGRASKLIPITSM